MRIVTSSQMKRIEQCAAEASMSFQRMMENAGSAAATIIRRVAEVRGSFVTVFCGRGNNGGDGLVVARKLFDAGANVVVVMVDGIPTSENAAGMYEVIMNMDIAVINYGDDADYLAERLAVTDLLVDAVYGTGFHGELDERHRDVCRMIRGVGARTISLDIPSGVNADTGAADPDTIRAEFTIVFDSHKPATVLPAAEKYVGQAVLVDIGIPAQAHDGIEYRYIQVDGELVFKELKKRERETHKGSYGKLLVVGGSAAYMGAAALATLAAMRSGAGYVTLASTKEVCRAAFPLIPEAVLLPLAQNHDGSIAQKAVDEILAAAKKSTAILCGNGMGTAPDAKQIIYRIIKEATCPVIIDADGINAVSANIDILKHTSAPVILTPHPVELSRLTGASAEKISADPLSAGLTFAREYNAVVALKGAHTTIVTPDEEVYINTTGNAGLAKAGSGDVLAGIIASLAAQGHEAKLAAACGVWLHGLAGDYAAEERSQYGMLPRDVIDALTRVLADNDR